MFKPPLWDKDGKWFWPMMINVIAPQPVDD
jgi:hypothetical protein